MLRITAIVMASGISQRMDRDKLHLKIKNKFIYEYIFETLKHFRFYETIVAAKEDDILAKAESLGFLGISNTKYYLGQSESIKTSLKQSKKTDGFMFFVADQPFIKLSTIEKICRSFSQNPLKIIVPFYNGERGNPVIFPYYLKNELMSLENDQGGKAVIKNHESNIIGVDIFSNIESMDIDTPEDYERAKKIIY